MVNVSMTDPYNITALIAADTIPEMVEVANASVNGTLFGMAMIAIFFIALIGLKRYEMDKAMMSASFGCFLLSLVLAYQQWINLMFPLAFLLIFAFTAFYVFVVNR